MNIQTDYWIYQIEEGVVGQKLGPLEDYNQGIIPYLVTFLVIGGLQGATQTAFQGY